MIEADASNGRKVDGRPTTWPEDEDITWPVREYLDALDANAESLTDPSATWTTQATWTNKGQMKVTFA